MEVLYMNFLYTKNTKEYEEDYFLDKDKLRREKEILSMAVKRKIDVDGVFIDFEKNVQQDFRNRTQWNLLLEQAEQEKQSGKDIKIYMKTWDILSPDTTYFTSEYIDLYEKGYEICFFQNITLDSKYITKLMKNITTSTLANNYTLADIIEIQIQNEMVRVAYEHEIRSKAIKEGKKNSNKNGGAAKGVYRYLTEQMKRDIYSFIKSDKQNISAFLRVHTITRKTFKNYLAYVKEDIQNNPEWYENPKNYVQPESTDL